MEPGLKSFLMGLPLEVRIKILEHLLPNLSEIKVFDGYYDSFNPVNGYDIWMGADKVITNRIASIVQYRDDGEKCHTAILRVSHQLYIEGTAIMYNRAFRAVITARGLTFLKCLLTSSEWCYKWGNIPVPSELRHFPFHMAKQVQIEFWATRFKKEEPILYDTLLGFCLVLCNKPSLKNVRVDLYDRDYRPKPVLRNRDRMADGSRPNPPQHIYGGEVLDGPFQRTEEEVDFWSDVQRRDFYDLDAEPWERAAGRNFRSWPARGRELRGLPRISGLEEALEPLKLLAHVGRANINLTPGAGNDPEMVAVAEKLQDSMMHQGLRHEMDLTDLRLTFL